MSSLKAFLSDQETKVDLLNNEAIAKTIVALLGERPDRPVTVGVHGDWGVGKSSILEMIESELDGKDSVVCLKFNGWRFQGFEDAKIALLEGIVEALLEKRPALTKALDEVKAVWHRIDLLKLAKRTTGLIPAAMTLVQSHDPAHVAIASAVAVLGNTKELGEDAKKAIEGLQEIQKKEKPKPNVPHEVREFQKAFERLLEKAGISQLIVLVDDLDRCLPETAIETMEAIRLFVLMPKTAFVIAADEAMIEYSVRRHFPDLPTSSGPQTYARNYLEKLIQVPFRIPALGEAETKMYVALALAQVNLGEDSTEFKNLLDQAREAVKRPWLGAELADDKVDKALGDRKSDAAALLSLSNQICPILARGTSGNRRQIKRFLNTLLLQERIAEARGFSEDVKLPVLAKLLLASRFSPQFYDQIVLEASADPLGISNAIKALEDAANASEKATSSDTEKKGKADASGKAESPWQSDPWVQAWNNLDPKLSSVDIRPYAFVANQQARMSLGTALGPLASIVERLMGSDMAVAGMEQELSQLAPAEAKAIFDELARRVRGGGLQTQPAGVSGMRSLVKVHATLQKEVMMFLKLLPQADLGAWAVSGWSSVLPAEQATFKELVAEWGNSANRVLSSAAKATSSSAGGKK